MFENLTTLDYIALSAIAFIVLLAITLLSVTLIKMQNRMEDMSRMMYIIIKKNDIMVNSDDDVKHALSTLNTNLKNVSNEINDNIGSLSSSTKEAIKVLQETSQNQSYLPTPNLAQMIRDTIMDSIRIEVLLNKDLRIPNKKSTEHIIETALRTYPNVDREYICKVSLAMIENFKITQEEEAASRNKK